MVDRIERIVAELPGLENVSGVWAEVDERVAAGDAAFCADLGIAVARSDGAGTWQCASVFDHVLRLLSITAGRECAAQALRLVTAADTGAKRLRYVASVLASGHRAEDLTLAYTEDAPDELRACLVQELVLRGVPVGETPGVAEWLASPGWTRHPLSRLPLVLTEVEGRLELPSFGAGGVSHPLPYGPSDGAADGVSGGAADGAGGGQGRPVPPGAHVPPVTEVTKGPRADAIAAAVANWASESNGRIEARVFDLAEPLHPEAMAAALPELGLDCLAPPEPEKPRRGWPQWGRPQWGRRAAPSPVAALSVRPQPPDQAFRLLFAAASTGGAYNSGAYGAYGRLAAWRSAAGLSGAGEDTPVREIAARVRECRWFTFESGAPWFEQVAWDIGLATLSPDGRTLTTLAATDTD